MFVHNCGYTLPTVCVCLYVCTVHCVHMNSVVHDVYRYVNLLVKITVWLGRSTISRNDDIPFYHVFWLTDQYFFPMFLISCSQSALTAHLIFDILHLDWSIDASKIYGMLLVSAQSWDCTHPIKSSNFCTFYLWSFFIPGVKVVDSNQHSLDHFHAQFYIIYLQNL